jgi:YbbR domain-containing protein
VSNLGYKVLAVVIAVFLWGVVHGTSSVERGFDLPIVLQAVPDDLVVTDQTSDQINVRVRGSRTAMRFFDDSKIEYAIDLSGAKVGLAEFDLDVGRIDLPRGLEPVSRSPARVEVTLQPRATKVVKVRPDVAGEPPAGFVLEGVDVEPERVKITGARSEVLRLSEVVTEPIDVTGFTETTERQVRVAVGGGHLWVDGAPQVKATVRITKPPEPAAAEEAGAGESPSGA